MATPPSFPWWWDRTSNASTARTSVGQDGGIVRRAEPRFGFGPALRESIAANLAAHPRRVAEVGDRRRAAVAIVIVDGATGGAVLALPDDTPEHGMDGMGDAASFLLCRRASRLNKHAGQWALPGGRLDPGETVVDAALRELHEEIGLELDETSVVGRLDDYPTRSGYIVSPVVLWGGAPDTLVPNPDEVRAVYRIALSELCRDDSPRFVEIPESDRPVVQLPLGSFLLHAPTAAVMLQFRWVGLDGDVGRRVDDLEQPVFAWK